MLRRLLRLTPALCSAAACVVLAAWAGSRLATDRWIVTQLMFWVPSPAYLLPAILLASIGARPWARRRPADPDRHRRLGRVGVAASIASIGLMLLVEWRLPRALFMPAEPDPARSIRIVHWNLSAVDRSFRPELFREIGPDWPAGPDALFLSTQLDHARLNQAAASLGQDFAVRRIGTFTIISRFPVRNMTVDSLGIPSPDALAEEALTGAPDPGAKGLYGVRWIQKLYNRLARLLGVGGRILERPDPGFLVRATLETSGPLGRPIVVWLIDLPSSPLAPRYVLAKAAAAQIEKLIAAGAAPPDLLLGDFNIPRSSASIQRITAAAGTPLTEAFDQAGWGPTGSWPRERPIWLIDHLFTAPSLAVAGYDVVNGGVGEHRAQRATITTPPR